jgi:hypothetical protein
LNRGGTLLEYEGLTGNSIRPEFPDGHKPAKTESVLLEAIERKQGEAL